jgi:hypothetical protein
VRRSRSVASRPDFVEGTGVEVDEPLPLLIGRHQLNFRAFGASQ